MHILERSWTTVDIKAPTFKWDDKSLNANAFEKSRTIGFVKTKQEILLAAVKLISVYKLTEYVSGTLIRFGARFSDSHNKKGRKISFFKFQLILEIDSKMISVLMVMEHL